MRLSTYEIEMIITSTKNIFGDGSKVYLFGSRIDDKEKGGDIDLYIQTSVTTELEVKKTKFLTLLDKLIGEQKVDLIFAKDKSRSIEIEALSKGIELNLEKIKLQKYFNECDKHLQRIEEAYEDIEHLIPINSEKYQALVKNEVQAIDQYLFRFAKLQDTLGDKIFKLIIVNYESNSITLPFIDILNKLEKFGYLTSAKEWMILRKIRNDIAHQYDDEPEQMSQALNIILTQKDVIKSAYHNVKKQYEKLLAGKNI